MCEFIKCTVVNPSLTLGREYDLMGANGVVQGAKAPLDAQVYPHHTKKSEQKQRRYCLIMTTLKGFQTFGLRVRAFLYCLASQGKRCRSGQIYTVSP